MWSTRIIVLLFLLLMSIGEHAQDIPENVDLKPFSWVMQQIAQHLKISEDLKGPFTMTLDKFARPYSDDDGRKVIKAEGVIVEGGVLVRVARVYGKNGVMYKDVAFYASEQGDSSVVNDDKGSV